MKFFLYIFIFIFFVPNAFGLDLSAFVMFGYGAYEEKGGAEISLGMQLRPYESLKLDIAPFTGIFKRKNDPRYSREKDDDNQRVCKDKSTGAIVDSKYCGINFKYAFESSLKYQIFESLDIGVGTTVSDRALYYGVAVIRFTPSFGLEGKVGEDYNSLLFRVDF